MTIGQASSLVTSIAQLAGVLIWPVINSPLR